MVAAREIAEVPRLQLEAPSDDAETSLVERI